MAVVFIGALIIGLTLGLLGSGGSAITVPVLVYIIGHHAKQSIAESMAIVGLISIVAAIPYAKSKLIDWRSVWYFGLPGMFGTFVGAWLGGLATNKSKVSRSFMLFLLHRADSWPSTCSKDRLEIESAGDRLDPCFFSKWTPSFQSPPNRSDFFFAFSIDLANSNRELITTSQITKTKSKQIQKR